MSPEPTMDVVLRHPKERKSKCTLEPLRGRSDLRFLQARPGLQFDADSYILLSPEGVPLGEADVGRPLLLLDSTWKLLPALERCVAGSPRLRCLPAGLRTAYPRRSRDGSDPESGLASVEALYAARRLLGRRDDSLLESYHWREAFLRQWADGE